jgi:uroporphyrinogen-III synthase
VVTVPSFSGLRVLVLESRRAKEMAALVTSFGGRPVSAPALREIPLERSTEARAFSEDLIAGRVDLVVLLTGVGTRALLDVVDHAGTRDAFVAALSKTRVAVRGPKPLAVLRELRVQPWVTAPEPNTWRELLAACDERAGPAGLKGQRVAVQEYGASNPELVRGLEERGAVVTRVPVYRWALPEDLAPLRDAVAAIGGGTLDVALFTTATQAAHLFQVAAEMGLEDAMRRGLGRMVVASIGPTTSEELHERSLMIDLEASHPKMGQLVRDAAERAPALLASKRAS